MENNKKFILEFDEPPAFIYVAENVDNEAVYIDGNRILGWTGLELKTKVDELPGYKLDVIPVKEIKEVNK